MSVKGLGRASVVGGLIAALGTSVALASAPTLKTGSAYDTFKVKGNKDGLSLTLITSASNPRRLIAGPPTPPLGSQFAESTGFFNCSKAKRNPGLPKSLHPFLAFSFPGANLKLAHGHYGFSVTKKVRNERIGGSPTRPFKLTVKLTGVVRSSTSITGKLKVEGGPCKIKGWIAYTAKYDKNGGVAPGD